MSWRTDRPLYEERRTTPDSTDRPIWGKRQDDRFFPWMTANHTALIKGWPLAQCGENVSPDGSILIPQETDNDPEIDRAISEMSRKWTKYFGAE